MKYRAVFLNLFAALLTLGITILPLLSAAQNDLPLDTRALFKTHVPHVNSQIGRGGGGAAGAVQPTATATFSGNSYTAGSTITPTSTIPEAEEHIAVSPISSSTLVAAVSDFALRGGFNTTKHVVSLDNGTTWAESYIPRQFIPALGDSYPATSDGYFWEANSDPVVAIDRLGNVYLADLYFDYFFGNANGFYVSVAPLPPSTGTPVAFTVASTYHVAVNPSETTNLFEDKPWIAVDNSNSANSGNVYVSWTHFIGNSVDMILFSRSTNHGQTWSAPIQISPTAQNGAVQGSQVAVGPNGEVYVAYEVFYVGGARRHFLAKSTNGGSSFSAPVAITPLFNELKFNSTYRKNSFPSLAVNPVNGGNGAVYVVYADQPSKTVGAEVEFIRSTNGGASFSTPVVINDKSTGQQFFPAVTVDSTGRIHASWFDTRNSPTSTANYDIYATYSFTGGASFAPNARVTATLVNAGTASFIGDYAGIAADGNDAHPVWTSGGFNNGSLQTATVLLPFP